MTTDHRLPRALWGTVALAAVLWFVTFYLSWSVFWIKIAFSASILAVLSFVLQPIERDRFQLNAKLVLAGISSAVLLYGIFWMGKAVSTLILPFAGDQIGGIYGKGVGTSTGVISLLLFFITGPAEEIYWRGFLQKNLMGRYGNTRGWLMATAIYAGVHIWSFNFMLVGAAAVAGAFWGAMYWRFNNLSVVIISHSIWSTVIFAFLPMNF